MPNRGASSGVTTQVAHREERLRRSARESSLDSCPHERRKESFGYNACHCAMRPLLCQSLLEATAPFELAQYRSKGEGGRARPSKLTGMSARRHVSQSFGKSRARKYEVAGQVATLPCSGIVNHAALICPYDTKLLQAAWSLMRSYTDQVALPADVRARLYDQALAPFRIGAWECELETERLTWTPGVYDIFDYPVGNPLRRANIVDLYVDQSRYNMERARAEVIRSGRALSLDVEIRSWSGESRWMRLSINATTENGRTVRIFGSKQDITSDRLALENMRRKAEIDHLTGLANRAVFQDRYRRIIGDSLNHGFTSALVLIDLDRFKAVNDTFGHEAGDACLREVGWRLGQAFHGAGLIARLGGDEFALILTAPSAARRIERVLRETVAMLRRPIFWNGHSLQIGASIGAALVGRPHRRRIAELFAEADAALYNAKAAGRDRVYLFGDEWHGHSACPEAA